MRRTPLAGAALIIAAALGRFGATKDNSPEAFDAGINVEGMGPGKSSSRHSKVRPKTRRVFLPRWWPNHQVENAARLYIRLSPPYGSRHGNCSDWIRENRRRRSCGMPQRRLGQPDVLEGINLNDLLRGG